MTYDEVGNMLTRGSTTFEWTAGRRLSGVENGKKIQYLYDHTGARVKKVVDGVATEYRMAGDLLLSEKTGTQTYWYRYDSGANLISVTIKGKIYFYVKNAQNDIIGLVDAEGNMVVQYSYDSWGKLLGITGSMADTIGVQNPFRYRGYYYDNETGMYYLKSRYYDPKLRRFISMDGVHTVKASLETLHNRNLYSYCNENPIVRIDEKGNMWTVAALSFVAGAVASVGTQMIFEGKSFGEINWVSAAFSGIGTAMSTMGANAIAQAAVSVIDGYVGNRLEGENIVDSVINAGINGFTSVALGLCDENGLNYLEYTKNYKDKVLRNIRDLNLDPIEAIPHFAAEAKIYKNGMRRITKANIESYSASYGMSKTAYMGYKKVTRRQIGWCGEYNGKTRSWKVYPVYA